MRASSEIRLGLGIVLGMQALTTLGAIGALGRMSPAIERILSENVASNEAVEEMLASLATSDAVARRETFEAALGKARGNVTEKEEIPVIEEIGREGEAVLSGSSSDARRLVGLLRELSEINRDSMRRADEMAKRLGSAGAWIAVLLGLAAFTVGALVLGRISRRVLSPMEELRAVIEARKGGDAFRRFTVREASVDLREMGEALNALVEGGRDGERPGPVAR
jgi:hypothetical protein